MNMSSSLTTNATLEQIHKMYSRIPLKQWNDELPEQFLIHNVVQPGDVILEVGGNIGRGTIVAAESTGSRGRVYTCEMDV